MSMKKAVSKDTAFALDHAVVILAGFYVVGREKLVDGEAYAAEQGAGVILG